MKENNKKNNMPKFNISWIYGIIILILAYLFFTGNDSSASKNASYSDFKEYVTRGYASKIIANKDEGILRMYVKPEYIRDIFKSGVDKTGKNPYLDITYPSNDKLEEFLDQQQQSGNFSGKVSYEQSNGWLGGLLFNLLPFILIFGVWFLLMRRMGGGAGGAGGSVFNVGKSKAKLVEKGEGTRITFKDVAGQAGAKQEVQEIVEFLKNPGKFTELGGKIPKGALLVGPPGTGKTLLAKAVAGEANVPFFSISGSEFVQMFVGMGAAKVRDLFKQAKEKAPCIVFIDEIDTIGKKRDGQIGGNDEREQTLNQLLTEMDGFDGNNGVVILRRQTDRNLLTPRF